MAGKPIHKSRGKLGAVGAVLAGLGMVASGLSEGDHGMIGQGVLAVFAGLGLFGIRARQDS